MSMINAVGLAGPGVEAWRSDGLTKLTARGATVVASIWGRTAAEFADAANALKGAAVRAIEVNASCPNLESRNAIFANSPEQTAELVRACADREVPLWIKLTLTAPNVVEVAEAAVAAGADALVLGNTLTGMVLDPEHGRPVLGNGGGGVSGRALLPIATRAIYDVRRALPEVPIVGIGGVWSGDDAIALISAGANAVGVGTASLANPRAPWQIQRQVGRWLATHNKTMNDIYGRAHG
jgi:dihydroorotate dehydrogenase (NAD+) catalytic subunit